MAAKMSQGKPGAAAAIKANVSASTIKRVAKPRTVKFTVRGLATRLIVLAETFALIAAAAPGLPWLIFAAISVYTSFRKFDTYSLQANAARGHDACRRGVP